MKIFTKIFVLTALLAIFILPATVYARMGDMSFFGGISEGRRLPRTTELLLENNGGNRRGRNNDRISLNYTELVFLDGRPQRFEGLLEIRGNGNIDTSREEAGTFDVVHRVMPSPGGGGDSDVEINRNVTFRVNWRVEGSNIIYDYEATSWTETITIGGSEFVLDSNLSQYEINIIEDRRPGVNYYRGDVSGRLVYVTDGGENVVRQLSGSFHGYSSAWSATETHRIDASVMRDAWAVQYQIRPSITVNQVLQFVRNEPMAISFEGNYRSVFQNNAGLRYDIFVRPNFMWDEPQSGQINLEIPNAFEQLHAPDLTFLRGNAAEDDVRRLFSMNVLTGDTRFFQPSQAITRGQFVSAVVRAIRLPTEQPVTAARARVQPVTSIFSDVNRERGDYPYIMAAHRSGLAMGRASGRFYADYPLDRQEAFVIMIRALGLQQLGLNPTPVTSFTDDSMISPWAKRYVSVAQQIGLAVPDSQGMFHPERMLSNGEAANIINELIEYMRVGLISDYADQIVNIVR